MRAHTFPSTLSDSSTSHAEAEMSLSIKAPRRRRRRVAWSAAAAILASTLPTASAQSCISLSGSTQCPAFNASSISTDANVTALFPFLSSVTDTASFDSELQTYINGSFISLRFGQLIGCSAFNSSDPSEYYARYTTSVLCNAIIQNSVTPCGLTDEATAPLCAATCALYAESEDTIATSSACGTEGDNAAAQIRADLTDCQIPADSISQTCILGSDNQPNNCGFADNTLLMCEYCGSSSPNATDSCCVFAGATTVCNDVTLPITSATSTAAAASSATSSAASSTSAAVTGNSSSNSHSLSGGAIAGLVIGCILGALLILAFIIFACIRARRNQEQKSSRHSSPSMVQHDGASARAPEAVEALPGGRVTRMSAMDGEHGGYVPPPGARWSGGTGGTGRGSPMMMMHQTPPLRGKSSKLNGVALVYDSADDSSPRDNMSSPEGTGQSEQLASFKDYYSQDEIHAGDAVSTLWAYQPRAQDEFELERGDMLKVVGIWDDGWATGVRIGSRADVWGRDENRSNRDSGVDTDDETGEEVKAFPLVCVCLPRYWRQTIDGEGEQGGFDFPGS